MFFIHFVLVVAAIRSCHSERVILELADGGTSRPLLLLSMEHIHKKDSNNWTLGNALNVENPKVINAEIDTHSVNIPSILNENILNFEDKITNTSPIPQESLLPMEHISDEESDIFPMALALNADNPKADTDVMDLHSNSNSSRPDKAISHSDDNTTNPLNISQENSTSLKDIVTTKSLELTTSTPVNAKSLINVSPTSKTTLRTYLPTYTPVQSTPDSKPVPDCHLSCLEALNETKLYSPQKLLLSQGSQLTLICDLPLNPAIILEDLVWLYHPQNSPQGQCALTTHDFIKSCQGFQTINDTKDQNFTFVRNTVTISNMLTKNSGQYICQVKVTCCGYIQEHAMILQQSTSVQVQVWLTDYTIDLAIAGSLTAVLAIAFLGGSYYKMKKQNAHYIYITNEGKEIKDNTVLHIPLVDDQDTDSFEGNFN